ncbi:ABC transporter transmembrane region 2 domain-containing protein [Trichoderma ceciliae]
MSRWSLLPEEMRLQVLETLAHSSNGKRGLTNYALVCSSWQSLFEKANFRRLILHQSDLDDLARIPRRCWPYVRHIWLRIELGEYHPPSEVIRPERLEDTAAYNDLIEFAVGNLFATLKSWEKVVEPAFRGMTLEMSIHSPSDSKYVCRGVHAKELDMQKPLVPSPTDCRSVDMEGAVFRTFGGYVHIKFYHKLPQLNLVKNLPRLEHLAFEPWKQFLDTLQDMVDAGYVNLVKGSLPAGLKQVIFLEDYEDAAAVFPELSGSAEETSTRNPNPYVSVALANRSLSFENLSASFLVEASDFFRAYKPEWIWRDLRSLTLTSQYLDSKRDSHEINDMLQAAGDAALAMPMLKTLEIWNGGVGHAAIFEYHGERGEAAIAWTSTWDLTFNPHVIDVWRRVGFKNHRCQTLSVEQRPIANAHDIRRYGDVIELLRTRKHVINSSATLGVSGKHVQRPASGLAIMAAQSNLRRTAAEDALAEFLDKWTNILGKRLRSTSRTTRTLATLSLAVSIILGAEGGRRWWKKRRDEREQGRKLVRTNSWLHNEDGSRTIYVPYKDGTSKVVINTTKPLTFEAHRRLFLNPPRVSGLGDGTVPSAQTKPGLNLAFLHQFLSLMSIMIPRWSSKEAGLLLSHGVFLMLRTYLSLVVARLDGELVRDLVAGHGKAFIWGIVKWCVGQGADQFITQDLTLFCASAANLYSSLGKPLVDICVFSFQLYRSLGPLAWLGLMSNYFLTASILRKLSPPFGKLKAVEGRKEGDFRSLHARLIANAEEVAFYGGAEMEKTFLNKEYKSLKSWMEGIYMLKIRYNILEDFILKYSWSAYGYLLASLPVFLPAWGGVGGAAEMVEGGEKGGRERNRMRSFITNKRLMLSLADAGGRMMYSIKDLAELAGYTSRVYTLISTLHRVHANAYYLRSGQSELYSSSDIQGTIQKGFDGVRLEQVPVVAPGLWPRGGEELLESLSMIVRRGEHLLISGPNGVGKTAISRVLAGLWPVYRGLVSRPKSVGQDGIMFLPQRPYLSPGTLRDQVIYPDGHVDMREKRKSEQDLQNILEAARLGYLPDREGGWDTRKEWKDVLSGGEKQRMQFARLLYHEPQYAIIDEGTSAVSSDVEGLLYETCKERGITLITISTRASLKKYHTYNLQLGVGEDADGWEFERIGTEREKMQVEKEVQDLRERLSQVDELKKRREEIEKELAAVWTEKGDLLDAPSYIGIDEIPAESEDPVDS